MWRSTIDWTSLGEVVGFVLVVSLCCAVLAAIGGSLWAVRARRKAWREYEARRDAIEQGTRIVPMPKAGRGRP